jgi:hypothetical protein
MPAPRCSEVVEMFARQDFAAWRGLPPDCTVGEVLERFAPQDDWIGFAQLGSDFVAASYRYCRVPSYGTPVRIWFIDERVVELEAMDLAKMTDVQELADVLGQPPARLDSYLGVVLVENGEWVYPERGLAFSTDSSGQHVSRLSVFASTDLEGYRRRLRVKTGATPMPEPDENELL